MQNCAAAMMSDAYNVCSVYNFTTASSRTSDHLFAKSELFNSWNLYVCFLSVLLNILGNPLIIVVIYKTRAMHSFTHYLFVNLAVSDMALGFSSIVSFVVRETLKEGSTSFPLDWVCKLVHTCPIPAASMVVSSFTLSAITCERFYHIAKPLKARVAQRNTKLIVGLIWGIALSILIPVIIYTNFDPKRHVCKIAVPHMALYVILVAFTAILVPLGLMLFCYYKTVVILWFSETDQRLTCVSTNRTALRKHRKKVTKFLGVVIVLFMACSLPVAVVLVARRYLTVPNGLFLSTILLAMFSSSVNPVIFMVQNGQFRTGLKNLVLRRNSAIIPNSRMLECENKASTSTV